jgi:aminopeptidase N
MPAIDRFDLYRRRAYRANDFVSPDTPAQYPPDLELEPVHLDIDLFIDIANLAVSGTVTTTVRARRDGPAKLTLDAVDFQELTAADANGRDLTWQYDGRKLTATWAEPFAAGKERKLAVSYRVERPVDGLYFSRPDEQYPDRPWYAATDHETERARHWLPCVDLPNVRTRLDWHLRADENYTILANGYLAGEDIHDDGTKTAHWRLEERCPSYLTCFTAGDFVKADDGEFVHDEGAAHPPYPTLPLAYFSHREHTAEQLLNAFGRTRPMMAWMTKKLAMPFPYPKYYQFSLPLLGGAMENISLVSWSDWFLPDKAMADEMLYFFDMVNVHEMAHSYFGDAVVCRDYAHAWLKESWATYMEQCWREDNDGPDEALYTFYDHAVSYFEEADESYQRPIVTRRFKSSWQMYDRHLYPGGACRLHTLRCELGDEVFWAGVQDYVNRYNGRVVETDDFRHVLEEHSGRSLGKFFDQWIHSPGYPNLKVSFDYDEEKKLGTFVIEQAQEDQDKGIPAFAFNTEVSWTMDGQEHRRPVKMDQARHVVMAAMDSEPEMVRFDPDCKVLHKLAFNPGDKMLRRQLTEAQDVIGRILAAKELAKTAKRSNIQAIVAAYKNEPFWGVREQMVAILAEAQTEAAVAGLAELVAYETDPIVLPSLFRAAGKLRDPRLAEALTARLAGDDLGPLSRQAAFQALGAQRAAADWDVLVEGSETEGYHGLAQSGAFAGLAATRRPEAVGRLLDVADYGRESNRVRPGIALALGDIGRGLEKAEREKVVEKLTDLLRDPWPDVHWRSSMALARMKATEAIDALEAYGRQLSHQEAVRVDKLVAGLRSEDKEDGSAVKKDVERLNDKVRRLEEQLQKLAARLEPDEES